MRTADELTADNMRCVAGKPGDDARVEALDGVVAGKVTEQGKRFFAELAIARCGFQLDD